MSSDVVAQVPSQRIPIILYLIASIFGALGQYFYKLGGQNVGLIPLYKNWQIFTGMMLFCGVMLLFVISFKLGGRMSVVYPVYASTFIWGTLISVYLAKEPFHWTQLAGVLIISSGVALITAGAR